MHRLLKKRDFPLLAAKLILVARSLYRTITEDVDTALLGKLGDRLASLRQRLLRNLDRRFQKTGRTPSELVADMTAFSLITSSSGTDVVKHFQHLRLHAIKRRDDGITIHAKDRLSAYLSTQQEIRTVYPDLLLASLKTVAAGPLLQDPAIPEQEDLSLDIYLAWMSSDVKNFTPYPRYTDLQQPGSATILDTWTEDAMKALLDSMGADVREIEDFDELIQVRKDVIQAWLSSRRYKSNTGPRQILDQLRSLFTDRLESLGQKAFSELLTSVADKVEATLEGWDSNTAGAKELWSLATPIMDFSNAALSLRESIKSRKHGELTDLSEVMKSYEIGWKQVSAFQDVVKRTRETRWDDDDFDDDDSDDDTRISHLLSKQDPSELQQALARSASNFVDSLEHRLSPAKEQNQVDCSSPIAPGLYLLRVIRELRQRLPSSMRDISSEASQRLICQDTARRLHGSLTETVTATVGNDLAQPYLRSVHKFRRLKPIWDGTPPLPLQLSPAAFSFLRSLVKHTESFGADVWAPDAIRQLHQSLAGLLVRLIETHMQKEKKQADKEQEPPQTNGVHDETELQADGEEKENGLNGDSPEGVNANGKDDSAAAKPPSPEDVDSPDVPKNIEDGAEESSPDDSHQTNGTDATPDRKSTIWSKDDCTQLLFDVLYMDLALPTLSSSQDGESQKSAALASLMPVLTEKAGLSDASVAKMRKSSADYWRRTYLLFGLLSV